MFKWLKNLFSKKQHKPIAISVGDVDGDYPDWAKECILQAFNTGKIVIGNCDENGKVTVKEMEPPKTNYGQPNNPKSD